MRPVPVEWETRLRDISPIVDQTSHLRFRWRPKMQDDFHDVWELYACTPVALLDDFRVHQLTQHWSDLPPSQQMGRKQCVTEYQHYMFRTHRVEARRFWVLQGPNGGTPAVYSRREARLLKAIGVPDDPPPLGFLAYAPFDERAVRAILQRDKLVQAGGDLDRMERARSADALRSEDDDTEKDFRRAFLGWWFDMCLPMSDFMQTYLRTTESERTLRKATRQENDALAQWKDHFIETGDLIGATNGSSRALQVPVTSSLIAHG